MSQLYVRVKTSFYTHKKLVRLRMQLGQEHADDAYWIVPRLWAYAAENQADGDMSGYTSEELAMLIGCSKHASSILQVLKDSGFIDPDGWIHGWEEHNGYHKTFSERAKTAAAARWGKKEKNQKKEVQIQKEERGDKHCSSIAQALLEASELPESLNNQQFLKSWEEWETYRKAKRKTVSEIGGRRQILQLSKIGWARATAAIEHSIRNDYQGIFEPNANNQTTNSTGRNNNSNAGSSGDYANVGK